MHITPEGHVTKKNTLAGSPMAQVEVFLESRMSRLVVCMMGRLSHWWRAKTEVL